jgi:hypothetical protein
MRTCGNYNCPNYGNTWDTQHHSSCPYCKKINEESKEEHK